MSQYLKISYNGNQEAYVPTKSIIDNLNIPNSSIYQNTQLLAPDSSYTVVSSLIKPLTNNSGSIGTSNFNFSNGYFSRLNVSNSIYPTTDNTLWIGYTKKWKGIYVQQVQSNRNNTGVADNYNAELQLLGFPDATTATESDKRTGTVRITVRDATWSGSANNFIYGSCGFKLNTANEICLNPQSNNYGNIGSGNVRWNNVFANNMNAHHIIANADILPDTDGGANIGSSTQYFDYFYTNIIYSSYIASTRPGEGESDSNARLLVAAYPMQASADIPQRDGYINFSIRKSKWVNNANQYTYTGAQMYWDDSISGLSFIPRTDNQGSIGTATYRWKQAYFNNLNLNTTSTIWFGNESTKSSSSNISGSSGSLVLSSYAPTGKISLSAGYNEPYAIVSLEGPSGKLAFYPESSISLGTLSNYWSNVYTGSISNYVNTSSGTGVNYFDITAGYINDGGTLGYRNRSIRLITHNTMAGTKPYSSTLYIEAYPAGPGIQVYTNTNGTRNFGTPSSYWGTVYTNNTYTRSIVCDQDFLNISNTKVDSGYIEISLEVKGSATSSHEESLIYAQGGTGLNSSYLKPSTNGTIDLGSLAYRFHTIYASTGTIQTSDRASKSQIHYIDKPQPKLRTLSTNSQEETFTTNDIINFIKQLNPATFVYNNGENEQTIEEALEKSPASIQLGLIADDIKDTSLYKYIGVEETYDKIIEPEEKDEEGNIIKEAIIENVTTLGLKPIPLATLALTACKYLININEQLELRIENLESKLS